MLDLDYLAEAGVSEEEEALLEPLSNLVKLSNDLKSRGIHEIQSMIKLELQTNMRSSILKRLVQAYNSRQSELNHAELETWLSENQ